MSGDLAYVDPTEMIEQAADPGAFVVQCLERGKSWLAEALEHNDLDALRNMKGYAETLRVATMQKQLGKDAQLSATELVRRAERCIGLGIRQGQEAGEIRDWGHGVHTDYSIPSPREAAGVNWNSQLSDIYAMSDDVADEEFEEAVDEAKAEGNLSRNNLTEKLKPHKAKPKPKDRDEFHNGTRRINPTRIIEETVSTLEGLAMALDLIEADHYAALDAEKRLEWLEALRQPLSAINRMKKGLSG